MNKTKVLVIGASGLVGKNLCKTLEWNAIEAKGTYYSRPIEGMLKLDVKDQGAVQSCLETLRPEVVFLAVITRGGVDYCETHPEEAHALNVEGTKNVAIAAARWGAKLVYYSTDYIFDGKAGPYSEEDDPNPINVYGQTKLEAEKLIQEICSSWLIVRTTGVFGWDKESRNFAMQVWKHLSAGKSMRVPNDQWGNPTLAGYLVEVSVRLIEMGAQGIFNVVGKDRMPRSELGKALAKVLALDPNLILPAPTSELDQVAFRPLQGGLKTEKLEWILRTEPISLDEALKCLRHQWQMYMHIMHPVDTISSKAEKLKREILDKARQYYQLVHKPQHEFASPKRRIQYAGRVFGEEEVVNLVDSALDFFLTLGPYGEVFEQKMKRFFGAKDFVFMSSGSTANLTAVLALMSQQLDDPLKPGDEVITPAMTFPTTLSPIVHSGLIPVFVDCEVGTYNINSALIEGAISEKTRAIMIPHTLGNPCDMDIICELVERYNLYLIEDACDALGSTLRGQLVGTFGDLGTLSFYPAHHITTGEGGGVVVNKARLSRIVRSVRDWGRDCWCGSGKSNTCGKRFGWQLGSLPKGYDHKYIYSNIGYNFKPTDMQAAIGSAQADRIGGFIEKRRENFMKLYKGLEPYQDYLILPKIDPRANPSWFGFPITVKNSASRQELVQWLEDTGIETRMLFAGNILHHPGYQNIQCRVFGTLEQTDRIMRDTFFIGVYPGLTDEMIQFILDTFERFFKLRRNLLR